MDIKLLAPSFNNNHSFWNYFVDKTRQAENYLPAGAVDYVTGHSIGDSERSNYGHGYGLKQICQGLLKLDFSFLKVVSIA